MEPEGPLRFSHEPAICPCLGQINPAHPHPLHHLRCNLTSSDHLRPDFPAGLCSSDFPTVIRCAVLVFYMYYMLRPAHPPLFAYPNITRCVAHIIKQFYPVSCYFLPRTPKYLPQHPILEHQQPMFFP